jgi:hypothetical protein
MELKPEIRQALYLVAATWILSGVLYIVPYHIFAVGSSHLSARSVAFERGLCGG